jgi:membrane-associated phospholipid phosphatase
MFIPETRRLYVKLFLIGALTWGSLVALSRVIRGDHFLSDVVVGGYITVFLFYLLSQLFQMKRDAK